MKPIRLWAIDCHGVFTASEGAWHDEPGSPSRPIVGESAFDLYKDSPTTMSDILRGLRGEEFSSTSEIKNDSFEVHYCPMCDARGGVRGLMVVTVGIPTGRGQDRGRENITPSRPPPVENQSELTGSIAHDLNNLLTVILGTATAASRVATVTPDVLAHLQGVKLAAEHAAILTRQLLAYSGFGHRDVRRLDLSAEARDLEPLLATVIPKNVHFCIDANDDLPPVEADAVQLKQVFMNIVTNAAESIGDAEGMVRVTTGVMNVEVGQPLPLQDGRALVPGSYVFLEVEDTGSGIDETTLARIFEPFFTTKLAGHGLGLAAVLGIVRAHRGGLLVHSKPGKGTTFKVLLPAQADELRWPPEAPSGVRPGDGLVLDDD